MYHDKKTSGHLGLTMTLSRIRQRYYLTRLQQDFHQYLAGCDACSRWKNPIRKHRTPMHILASGVPMERLASDIFVRITLNRHRDRHIVVVADYFTKWTEVFALPNIVAKTITRTIIEKVVLFGVIHSESKLFMEMCRNLGIANTRTTLYHP